MIKQLKEGGHSEGIRLIFLRFSLFRAWGPEPDWQPAVQQPYYTGKNPASQYSVWEHCVPLFQMIGGLALPVQPVAQRLCLRTERSWDGLDDLDVALFRLKGFSLAISRHDGNPSGDSFVWLTEPHEQADKALDTLLEVVGIGENAVAFRGDPREDRAERAATAQGAGPPDEVGGTPLPTLCGPGSGVSSTSREPLGQRRSILHNGHWDQR